jgi:putative sterol carrier protein
MPDATAEFFDEPGRRGHEPWLEKARGTLRFDLVDGEQTDHWLVTIDKGDVSVSRKNIAADCVVRMDKALFDDIVIGEKNAMAALLRGAVGIEGDVELLMLFQRLFPGPPTARGHVPEAGYARRQS